MKTRKKEGGNFNSGTRRLRNSLRIRNRLPSRLKKLIKKKSRKKSASEQPPTSEQPSKLEQARTSQQSPKQTTYTRIPVKYISILNEDGNCIEPSPKDKEILNKGIEIAEILTEIVNKKRKTTILKDILDIDLKGIKRSTGDFIILNKILEILKRHLNFALRRFVPCGETLKKDYISLNDKNLKAILENLKKEIKNLKTE